MAQQGIPSKSFDADKRQEARATQTITIGGRVFHPRKRSVNMMKELAVLAPEAFGTKEFDREKNPTRELEIINEQINALLRDDEDNEPGAEFLDENLDMEDGYALLDRLIPKMQVEQEQVRD